MKFRSDPSTIRGSIAPVVTPFDEGLEVDLATVRKLVEWQIESGSHGISVGGSTGEPGSQTCEEREAVINTAASVVADRVPFMPGTGTARLDETLRLTAAAERAGADAVLVITPYYARPTQEGLFRWYAAVAEEFPSLPIVIYNVPVRTAVDIAPPTVGRLRRAYDNIVGIKETTKDFEHASYVLHECGRDFLVYSGIELLCFPLLAIGGVGHLSTVANVFPKPVADLYTAYARGDWDRGLELHYELHPLVDMAFLETNPGPVKHAMELLGLLAAGIVRPPLAPPSPETKASVAAVVERYASVPTPVSP